MRILFISSTFPTPNRPTAGVFNLNLCKALAMEHEVRVICPWSWLERLSYQASRKLKYSLNSLDLNTLNVSYPTYYYTPKILRELYGSFLWASIRGDLKRTMDQFKPECIISYWAHPDGEVGARAAKLCCVPSTVIVGGSDVMLLPSDTRRRECVINVLENTDAVVTVGEDLKKHVVGLGILPEKVFVRPQGIDDTLFNSEGRGQARRQVGIEVNGPVLLSVGRLVTVKGLEVLLQAASILKKGGLQFQLVLIGDGPLKLDLQNQAKRLGILENIKFIGVKPQAELPDWYRAANLTVLSSHSEGVPNVLRESIACGTPFVATNVGGVSELAEEGYDRLVPANDPAALAEAIKASLAAPRPSQPRRFQPESWQESAKHLVQIIVNQRNLMVISS